MSPVGTLSRSNHRVPRIALTCLQISGSRAGTWFARLSRSRKLRAAVARRRDQRARFRAWLAQLWRRSDSFWISGNRTGHPKPPAGRDSFEHSPGSAERPPATTGRGSPGLPRSCGRHRCRAFQEADAPRRGRIQADQMMIHRSPRAADPPGRGRDVLLARAVNGIIIADGPVRTNVPGQWRFSLSEMPSAGWRDRLLELAIADPVAAALDIKVEGASLLFISGETMREALEALRALYRLLRNATLPAR